VADADQRSKSGLLFPATDETGVNAKLRGCRHGRLDQLGRQTVRCRAERNAERTR
jgi:hypothetical protein